MTQQDRDEYVLDGTEHDEELRRIRTIEADWDPKTARILTDLGVATGWKCLEVGAGGGGVAKWMAEKVGPSGRVVATDINMRFLDSVRGPNLEVRRHNIVTDDLEEGVFDVAHCRTLLIHMREPEGVMRRMVRALRPGGVLVVEEPVGTHGHGDPGWARAEEYNRAMARHMRLLGTLGVDMSIGSRLPGMLVKLGLDGIGGEATSRVIQGGSGTRLMLGTVKALRGAMVASGGATDAEIEEYIGMLSDPAFLGLEPPMVSVWGRTAEA